ncbi:MAG: purine-binding chemotaxis protein CheW [Planctomycetes bacterium]|nr:purine-binding chemotaxis protein CheW [Planctomycetota bacterium]
MNTQTQTERSTSTGEIEFSTFRVGGLLMGIDIRHVQEINRIHDITPVPYAPENVRGVINLRGEVVTVIDLRTTLQMAPAQSSHRNHIVIVNIQEESIGLLVDKIADVVITTAAEIEPPPANVSGVDSKYLIGVCKLEEELMVILNVKETFSTEPKTDQ